MSDIIPSKVYANIGNQLANGNNIPIADPVVCNATQELEKEIARLRNDNKLLQSKLTKRDHQTLTMNQFLSKYNFHEIFIPDSSMNSRINAKAYRDCSAFGQKTYFFEVKQNTDGSFPKETMIKYLEYSIGYDYEKKKYVGNINDITHLYDALIYGYYSSNYIQLRVGEYTKLIKLLTRLSNKHLLPEGLKPIDKICLCDTINITEIDGNQCKRCNTNYIEHMFEKSNWNMIYTEEDKTYFYDSLEIRGMDFSVLITWIIVPYNRNSFHWTNEIFLSNINRIRFARIFSNIAKLTFKQDISI